MKKEKIEKMREYFREEFKKTNEKLKDEEDAKEIDPSIVDDAPDETFEKLEDYYDFHKGEGDILEVWKDVPS